MKQKKLKTIQKKKISRECWNLDLAFYNWLDERLPVYLKEAGKIVNLDYHTFEIEGKEYTQKEVIEMMIEDVHYLIEYDTWSDGYDEKMNRLLLCWSKVLPAMWW